MPNELLQSSWPVGTPQECEEAGIDTRINATCFPSDDQSVAKTGIKGCSYYDRCIFAQAHANGAVKAFRDDGPKNIAWNIHLAEWGKDKPANEDWGPCYRFMATMHERRNKGIIDAMQSPNKPRDEINIIAEEGETIWLHREVSINPGSKTQLGTKIEDVPFQIPFHNRPSKVIQVQGKAAEIQKLRELERQQKADNSKGKKSAQA